MSARPGASAPAGPRRAGCRLSGWGCWRTLLMPPGSAGGMTSGRAIRTLITTSMVLAAGKVPLSLRTFISRRSRLAGRIRGAVRDASCTAPEAGP